MAFQQGKNIVHSSPHCQTWQGNNFRGFPAPKAETDLPWWRAGRREGVMISLPSSCLL